ncbi:class I histocompatibility antigen, F10 alpha chain-like [Discoglossus pictus]
MYGCELDDDGTTRGYDQYGYDGRDFLSLDKDRGIWVPVVNEAQITTERWNSPEVGAAERQKNYLEEECIDWLRKYISAGREELERRVPPRVKVSHHQSDGNTKLNCQVYGFYPRDVHVKWVKNEVDDVYSEEAKQILPNPDGTYQTRVTVEVTLKEGDSYSCHVDHKSLGEKMMIIPWDPPKDNTVYIIIGVIAALVIAGAGIGYFVYKKIYGKKSAQYTAAAPSENSSGSSNT